MRSYRQLSLTSVPGKSMEQILQEIMPRSCIWARAIPSTGTGRWSMDEGEGLQGIDGQKFNMAWPHAGTQKPPVPWADPPAWAIGGLEWDDLEGPLQSKAFHDFIIKSSYTTMIKYTKSKYECASALLAYFLKWRQTFWWENMWQSIDFHLFKRGKRAPSVLHGTSPGTMKRLVHGYS